MGQPSAIAPRALGPIFCLLFASHAAAQINIQLSRESEQAFDDYVKDAEAHMEGHARFADLAAKSLTIAPGGALATAEVRDALIHDWTAALFVPGATMQDALAVLESYDEYKQIYAPHVTDSRALDHKGNRWRVYLRLNKTKGLVVVVLDTEYGVEYKALSKGRWSMVSRSDKISEVQFGRAQPVGTGVGFMWRLNAYWLIEPRPGGVYLECRSISMSRDIPAGLGWMIKPMVTSLPRESLRDTMNDTAKAIMQR